MKQKYVVAGLAILISLILIVATALSSFNLLHPFDNRHPGGIAGGPVTVDLPDDPLEELPLPVLPGEPGLTEDLLSGLLGGDQVALVLSPEPPETAPQRVEPSFDPSPALPPAPALPEAPEVSPPVPVPEPIPVLPVPNPAPMLTPNLPAPVPPVFQQPQPEPAPGEPPREPQPSLLGEVLGGVTGTVGGLLS